MLGACVIGLLAAAAAGLADYWRTFAQNIASDLIGGIVAMYVLIPLAHRPRPDNEPRSDTEQKPIDKATTLTEHGTRSPDSATSPPGIAPDAVETSADTTT